MREIRHPGKLWHAVATGSSTSLDRGMLFSMSEHKDRWYQAANRGYLTDEDKLVLRDLLFDFEATGLPGTLGPKATNVEEYSTRMAARGEAGRLINAFNWSNTPQGGEFWNAMHSEPETPEAARPTLSLWARDARDRDMVKSWGSLKMPFDDCQEFIDGGWQTTAEWLAENGRETLAEKFRREKGPTTRDIITMFVPCNLWLGGQTAWDLRLDGSKAPEILELLDEGEVTTAADLWKMEFPEEDWGDVPIIDDYTDALFDAAPKVRGALVRHLTDVHSRTYVPWARPELLPDGGRGRPHDYAVGALRAVKHEDDDDANLALAGLADVWGDACGPLPGLIWLLEKNKSRLILRLQAMVEATKKEAKAA